MLEWIPYIPVYANINEVCLFALIFTFECHLLCVFLKKHNVGLHTSLLTYFRCLMNYLHMEMLSSQENMTSFVYDKGRVVCLFA